MNATKESVDLTKLCRMCAKPYKTYISLTELKDNSSRSLVEALLHYTGVLVCKHDELSTKICLVCFNELEKCERMRRHVIQAQGLQLVHISPTSDATKIFGQDQSTKPGLKIRNVSEIDSSSTIPNTKVLVKLEPVADQPITTELNEESFDDDIDYFTADSTDDILLTCRVCLQNFTPITFKSHICDISAVVQCMKCPLKFLTDAELKEHSEVHKQKKRGRPSSDKYIKCVHCDSYFEDPDALEQHLRIVGRQMQPIFNCDFCIKFFLNQDARKNHVLEAHAQKKIKIEYDSDA